jgi:hypothetical protein
MTARTPAPHAQQAPRAKTVCGAAAGALGGLGSLACAISMILAGLGVGASAASAGMAGMERSGSAPHGLLGLLRHAGPALLIASIVLVAAALAVRRPTAAVPALLAGAVLYAGMYSQSNTGVMYTAIALGYTAWAGLFLWTRKRNRAGARQKTGTDIQHQHM